MDAGDNAVVNYYQVGKIHMTLTEGLDDIELQPFLVNKLTGVVSLNFDPQRGMKGYFDFMVIQIEKSLLKMKNLINLIIRTGAGKRYLRIGRYSEGIYLFVKRGSESSFCIATTSTRNKE